MAHFALSPNDQLMNFSMRGLFAPKSTTDLWTLHVASQRPRCAPIPPIHHTIIATDVGETIFGQAQMSHLFVFFFSLVGYG
jgi:hypothetical protein